MYLNEQEVSVLEVLDMRDRRWWTSVEIAELVELPNHSVRSALKSLKRRQLAIKDASLKPYSTHRGDWAITGLGQGELSHRDRDKRQLRLA
jgi:DNA-binding IclR family transcriptional regulator